MEVETAGWHHQLNGHGFGWTLEVVMDREAWCAVVPPAKARDLGLIPGLGKSPGEGNGKERKKVKLLSHVRLFATS